MSVRAARSAAISRVPALMVAAGLAVFAFYFVFLRNGRPSSADASSGAASLAPQIKAPAAPPPEPAPAPAPAVSEPAEPSPADTGTPPVGEPPTTAAAQEWQQDIAIDRLIADGQPSKARSEIARLFAAPDLSDALRAELAVKAVAVNQRLLVTHPDPEDIEIGEIRQGENLITFSRRYRQLHGEYGIIKLLNNIRNDGAVRAGLKMRVPRGSWSVLVDKSLFSLYLCYEGAPFKTYRVCIGAKDNTPAATFTVGIKNPNPDWYAPPEWLEKEKETNPVRHANPKNPLGSFWIGIDSNTFSGFGIHGTNEPQTIGTRASMGCVRMLNAEVVELARCVWKGMDVAIVE